MGPITLLDGIKININWYTTDNNFDEHFKLQRQNILFFKYKK